MARGKPLSIPHQNAIKKTTFARSISRANDMYKLFVFILLFITFSCCHHRNTVDGQTVALGLESPKTNDIKGNHAILVSHTGFTLSYNTQWRIPNWVAYELTASKANGSIKRDGGFYEDPAVGPYTATASDYKGSGYSRGHMAPAGDMKWDADAMHESCYYSDICPQDGGLNNGVWNSIEMQIRNATRYFDRIYVVCGPIVSEQPQTIGTNHVAVPQAFFKAILAVKNDSYSSIAFYCTNTNLPSPYTQYALSVDELEAHIGMDLFYQLPDAIEATVEAQKENPLEKERH